MGEILFYMELEDAVLCCQLCGVQLTGMLVFRPLDIPKEEELTMTLAVAHLKDNQNPALKSLISVLGDPKIVL